VVEMTLAGEEGFGFGLKSRRCPIMYSWSVTPCSSVHDLALDEAISPDPVVPSPSHAPRM
jgi:hypothetical protein